MDPIVLCSLALCDDEVLERAGAEDTANAADEVGGAALRLLHQLSDCVAAAEALARTSQPPLPLLRRAMAAWGLAGRVLALETLKRALVLINRCCLTATGPQELSDDAVPAAWSTFSC
jgi:hypothetical protein